MTKGSSKKYLIFSLQDSLYSLDLEHVAEISEPLPMWPIPLAPACYSGVVNIHGNIVAVMNLPLFLGLTGVSTFTKVIVLQQEVASLAFLVDAVVRIVSEDDVAYALASDRQFAAATLSLRDSEVIQLDLGALIRAAENGMLENRSDSKKMC
jgi:purine-binding chemotaxis protein CheW